MFPTMATGVISDPSQNVLKPNQPQRKVLIIPAIPRKYDRKPTRPTDNACSAAQEHTGHTIEKGHTNVQKESVSFDHVNTSQNQEQSKAESEAGISCKSSENQDECKHSKKIVHRENSLNVVLGNVPQDFGIERNGYKLPPPFYPSSHGTILPLEPWSLPNTSQDRMEDCFVPSSPCPDLQTDILHPAFISTDSQAFVSGPTSVAGENISPQESSYLGYCHFPPESLRHQSPLTVEATHPPTEFSFRDCDQLSANPLQPTESSTCEPTPLPYSVYQGYTYGDVQPFIPPLMGSPPSQHVTAKTGHHIAVVDETEYVSPSCLFHSEGNELPAVPIPAPLSIVTQDTAIRTKASARNMVQLDDSAGESGIASDFSFHHQSNSESSLNSDDDFQLRTELKTQPEKLLLERPIHFETWRYSVLQSLNESTHDVKSSQHVLTDFLLQQFNDDAFADIRLDISQKDNSFERTTYSVHGVVIAQSSLLRNLMNDSMFFEDGKRVIKIRVEDRFVTPAVIKAALRVCYGESALSFKGSSSYISSSQSSSEVSISWMENALAFAKSGYLLGLQAVIYRGLQIASMVLNWENIETALSFLLDGGVDPDWNSENSIQATSTSASSSHNSSELNVLENAVPLQDLSVANSELNAESRQQLFGQSPKTHSPSARDLLYQCLHFIISEFPESWKVNVSSRSLADIDRLPMTVENKPPLSKSRLSRIQFGDHPSEMTIKSSNENITLSSIMLSLPFVHLKYIVDRLDDNTKGRNLKPLIKERERRRHQVLRSDSVPVSLRRSIREWGHAGWEEYVDSEQNLHWSIHRKWTGLEAPSSV